MGEANERWTISGLGDAVANTDQYAGGGAVAAMSLVGAAATAELVFQLSARRRDLDDADRRHLQEKVERARRLRQSFLDAIDADMDALVALMDAQRLARRARKSPEENDPEAATAQLASAVNHAIKTPLQVARDAATLLQDIEAALPLARTFTVSDLGAAAATTQGAIVSLVLMAEVNLGLLDDQDDAGSIGAELDELAQTAAERAGAIVASTHRVFATGNKQGGP